nr:PREDICTED: pancreatic progenitor cell differentiation and proliferation factor [Phalacrocorax carbo]
MASIPSSGSLMATHNYYRRRLSSTSSNSSCGSSEYSGEVIPHPPAAMTTVSESPESSGAQWVTTGPMACGLVPAPGAGRRRHASEPSSGPLA